MNNPEAFATIRFKESTAKRFRKYSKIVAKTHSESMDAILDFFINNKISPHENVGPYFKRLEKAILKKFNSIIAIIKNIEKTQLKPTTAMLTLLMEEFSKQKQPLLLKKNTCFKNDLENGTIEIRYLKKQNTELTQKVKQQRDITLKLMSKIDLIQPTFGKPYFKMGISNEEFETLKRQLVEIQ